MKMVSTLALAAVLTLGVASPALAQKRGKQEEAAAPKFEVSAAFRKAGAEVEKALTANDWAGAETALVAAEGIAKNDDEKYYAAYWRMRIETHKQNPAGIIKAADVLIANPKTPPAFLAEYNYKRGQATFISGNRPGAEPFLLKARELGNSEIDLPFMLAQIYGDANKVPQAAAEMGRAIDQVKAAGRKPEVSWYEWAFARVYKSGDRPASTEWMARIVKDFPALANWRRVVVLYRDGINASKAELTKKEKIDLFRLMRATGALVDEGDYFNYARSALEVGLPWEAQAVIAEGRASKKIPAGDADFTTLDTGATTAIRNEASPDALAKAAKDGKELASAGDVYLAAGNNARAVEVYDQALAKGGVDANAVNLHRGQALVALGRKDEARAAFALVTGSPLGDIAKLWLTWMDLPPLS